MSERPQDRTGKTGRRADGTPLRMGPRPLGLHLTAALGSLLSSSTALPFLRNGSLPWNPALRARAAALRDEMSQADRLQGAAGPGGDDRLSREVDREVRRRIDAVLTGIERYRRHPYVRDLPDPPVV